MRSVREVIESPWEVGVDERPIFSLTTTPWGSSPTSIAVAAYKYADGAYTDVTATVLPANTPAAVGDVITLSPLTPIAAGDVYRIEIKFTVSGSVLEAFAMVNVRR